MDPRLMKLLGIKVMAPVDEDGGADLDEDIEDLEDGEEEEEDLEDDEDEEDDDDEHEGDDEDDEEEDDDDEDEEDDDLGNRAKKRIGNLVKRAKSAEAQVAKLTKDLEAARRLSGEDGKAIMKAAEVSGILPELMSTAEAKAFKDMDQHARVIAHYEGWLDSHSEDDTYGDGDNAMSYKQVERRVKRLEADLNEMKNEYGPRRKELLSKAKKIFELGLEAFREGEEGGKRGKKTQKGKKKINKAEAKRPKGKKPKKAGGKGKVNWGSVGDTDDFVRMVASQNEGE